MRRSTSLLSSFFGSALLLSLLFGCGPPSSQVGTLPDSVLSDVPELADEIIRERINDAYVSEVPEENGISGPISWSFDEDEPKEISVVEKKLDGTRATLVLDIKTQSSPRSSYQRHLSGQIRTEWELRTGWVLRRWEIDDAENISMKYKDLPKAPPQNSNR